MEINRAKIEKDSRVQVTAAVLSGKGRKAEARDLFMKCEMGAKDDRMTEIEEKCRSRIKSAR